MILRLWRPIWQDGIGRGGGCEGGHRLPKKTGQKIQKSYKPLTWTGSISATKRSWKENKVPRHTSTIWSFECARFYHYITRLDRYIEHICKKKRQIFLASAGLGLYIFIYRFWKFWMNYVHIYRFSKVCGSVFKSPRRDFFTELTPKSIEKHFTR